jgi:cytochrome c biogenesis factor
MVRWMWIGATLIGFGAFVTVFDRRYRKVKVSAPQEALAHA